MTQRAEFNTGAASAAVFLSAAIWGLFWIPVRYFSGNGIGGEWALVLLYLPAFLLLLPYVLIDFRRQKPHFAAAFLIGLNVGAALAFYGIGILHTTVVRATLFFYLTPVWATLIGMLWLGEPFSWERWVAIALGVVGLFFLVAGGQEKALNIGDMLALLSGVFWAVGLALIKRTGPIPLAGMTLFQFFFSVVFVFGIGSLLAPIKIPNITGFHQVFVVMVLISLCMVVPAIFLLSWAGQLLYPGRVGLLMMSEALVAVFTASVFLPEENLAFIQWIGAALIICASIVELKHGDKEVLFPRD